MVRMESRWWEWMPKQSWRKCESMPSICLGMPFVPKPNQGSPMIHKDLPAFYEWWLSTANNVAPLILSRNHCLGCLHPNPSITASFPSLSTASSTAPFLCLSRRLLNCLTVRDTSRTCLTPGSCEQRSTRSANKELGLYKGSLLSRAAKKMDEVRSAYFCRSATEAVVGSHPQVGDSSVPPLLPSMVQWLSDHVVGSLFEAT